ncbi:hypothetical protein [Cyclobacterium jeungdonense]|uniref:hypothetical protein n=1 Tax=Cyclobacterium jeungdonense TaxID=708087 RepID=UPI0013D44F60|nr:hypothetical protein [Cyclobacterium jeungdonense]
MRKNFPCQVQNTVQTGGSASPEPTVASENTDQPPGGSNLIGKNARPANKQITDNGIPLEKHQWKGLIG